jgi:hypothetical protein
VGHVLRSKRGGVLFRRMARPRLGGWVLRGLGFCGSALGLVGHEVEGTGGAGLQWRALQPGPALADQGLSAGGRLEGFGAGLARIGRQGGCAFLVWVPPWLLRSMGCNGLGWILAWVGSECKARGGPWLGAWEG